MLITSAELGDDEDVQAVEAETSQREALFVICMTQQTAPNADCSGRQLTVAEIDGGTDWPCQRIARE